MSSKVRRITDVASKPEEPQQNLQGPSMDLPQADRIAAAEQLLRTSPGIIRYMDSERFPPDALNAQIRQNLPPGVMSWAQLKAWAQGNPTHTPGLDAQRITMLQVLHHQDREREQQKSGGVEGTHIPSNAQETPTPQQNRQDQVIINQFAKKLMDTAKPEVIQKFETDVGRWPDDKKQQLLDQGINPLFFRFRQHAEMLYKRGGPNKAGAVNTGAQNDILHQVASNDSSSQGLNPSAASIQETGAMSRDPSEPYSNFQTRTRTDVPDFDGYARVLPEAYLNMSGTHVAPSTQPKNTTVDELLSPFRRSSPYISDQDSFEKDNPAPLSSRPADDNVSVHYDSCLDMHTDTRQTNRVDMTSLENFDFDQFLKGDPGYDSAALQSRSQSPAIYGHISTRSPGFNNAAAEPDLQEQARLYYEQLYLLEYQNKKLLKPSGERWPWMAEKDNLPDGPPMQQQQRIPYGTQQTNQEREQRQEVQQHRDESVVIETQSPVTRREIDNDSGYVVLTQAQKDQMYQEQLALLEKQNHKRLLQKWQDEDQEQKTQEERWRHERLMRQQQRARQQNEDDLASYAVPDQPGYAGVSQNPNTQSSPFTGWNTPHLDRSHHPPQLPPNLERYLEHPDQYSESTFEQLQSQHRPYGSAQLPKVNTTQPLYPGPRPDMYRIDAGPSPPTSQQRPRDTHGSLDSEEPETAHGHLPGKVRYGRKLEGVPSPEERPPEPIWSPYNESRKLLDGDPLPELDHEGIALNRERPRYRSAGAHESPPLDYTPQPLNALPWPDRYGPLGPLQPSWAELERYSPKGGFQQSDGPPPPLPPPRVLSQLRKPSNRNDWAAAVQASRHDSFPAQAQRPSLPAPQDEPRSTTDTGGIPPNRLTYGSPSPRRDDPHDIPAYVNTWQPPDPAQVREELQLYGEMNRRVQAQGLPSTNRPTPEMLRAGWGHRSTLTRRV
ncbi:hypothetical protein J4E81_009220 [Alternaria sp. BMP 2799]|nr:hypothetical protein J4E81_009220 [Alternaria sp. BMP 2799]